MAAEMDNLITATKTFLKHERQLKEARQNLMSAVLAALRAGITPTEVVAHTPYTAAYVRRIARENGIEPAARGRKSNHKHV